MRDQTTTKENIMNTRLLTQTSFLLIGIAVLSSPTIACAERRGPPPEALDACSSSVTGQECSFEGRRHTVTGTCETRHEEMVCVPEHMRNEKGRKR
jgi:hypothetical protein